MELEKLFEQFLKEKIYVQNVATSTLRFYRQSFNAFTRNGGQLTKEGLKTFVINMSQTGIAIATRNLYIRGMNSFLTWLHENDHTQERLRIKQMKQPQTVIKTFKDQHIKTLIGFRPRLFYEWRTHTMICAMIDTGIRRDECASLTMSDVDFDNLFLKVKGKGSKERLVPFSYELRSLLYNWLKKRKAQNMQGEWLFPTANATKMILRNVNREVMLHCKSLGIEGVRMSPHSFRHYFAIHYLENGGDIYTLARIFGHSSIKVTEIYLRSMGIDKIQKMQLRLSPMSKR